MVFANAAVGASNVLGMQMPSAVMSSTNGIIGSMGFGPASTYQPASQKTFGLAPRFMSGPASGKSKKERPGNYRIAAEQQGDNIVLTAAERAAERAIADARFTLSNPDKARVEEWLGRSVAEARRNVPDAKTYLRRRFWKIGKAQKRAPGALKVNMPMSTLNVAIYTAGTIFVLAGLALAGVGCWATMEGGWNYTRNYSDTLTQLDKEIERLARHQADLKELQNGVNRKDIEFVEHKIYRATRCKASLEQNLSERENYMFGGGGLAGFFSLMLLLNLLMLAPRRKIKALSEQDASTVAASVAAYKGDWEKESHYNAVLAREKYIATKVFMQAEYADELCDIAIETA